MRAPCCGAWMSPTEKKAVLKRTHLAVPGPTVADSYTGQYAVRDYVTQGKGSVFHRCLATAACQNTIAAIRL